MNRGMILFYFAVGIAGFSQFALLDLDEGQLDVVIRITKRSGLSIGCLFFGIAGAIVFFLFTRSIPVPGWERQIAFFSILPAVLIGSFLGTIWLVVVRGRSNAMPLLFDTSAGIVGIIIGIGIILVTIPGGGNDANHRDDSS